MDEKLRILMQSENLTASRLAEILEIKPAAVSHILSGRNKPSFDLICKLVNRFPQINPYWLLGDAPEMHNIKAPIPTSENRVIASGSLFDLTEAQNEKSENSDTAKSPGHIGDLAQARSNSDVEKIIIVYQDQTFEVLKSKKI